LSYKIEKPEAMKTLRLLFLVLNVLLAQFEKLTETEVFETKY